MAQSYPSIPDTDALVDSRQKFLDRDNAIKSSFSGTSFPSSDLVVGQPCYRSDQGKLYMLTSTSPTTWTMIRDFNDSGLFLQVGEDLADLNSPSLARDNMGLGSAAVRDEDYFIRTANNLSDVPNKATARTNMGLGDAATKTVGTSDGNVVVLGATGLPAVSGQNLTDVILKKYDVATLSSGSTLTSAGSVGKLYMVDTSGSGFVTTLPSDAPVGYVVSFRKTSNSNEHTIRVQGSDRWYNSHSWGSSTDYKLYFRGETVWCSKIASGQWIVSNERVAPSWQTAWIPASGLVDDGSIPPTGFSVINIGAGKPNIPVYLFPSGADGVAHFTLKLPASATGEARMYAVWTMQTSESADVVWGAGGGFFTHGDTMNLAITTGAATVTSPGTTAFDMYRSPVIVPTIQNTYGAGDLLHIRFYRNGLSVSDSYSGVAALMGIELLYRVNDYTDYRA